MEVKNMRSKVRVMQECHALRSPRLTTYIDQYFFFIGCSIFNSEAHRLPRITYTFIPEDGNENETDMKNGETLEWMKGLGVKTEKEKTKKRYCKYYKQSLWGSGAVAEVPNGWQDFSKLQREQLLDSGGVIDEWIDG